MVRRNKQWKLLIVVLALGLSACDLSLSGQDLGTGEPSETLQPPPATDVAEPVITPGETEPAGTGIEDICLESGGGGSQFINEAGGYCLTIPEGFEVTQDLGLDIFVVGPTLAMYGQEGLILAFEFSVVGAPGGAGNYDALSWGAQVVEDNSAPDYELTIEPYALQGAGLDGVQVGPLPGMGGGESTIVRTNDTLYSITVYPDRISSPEFSEQVDALWAQLSDSIRFFEPVDTGVRYRTADEICPKETAGARLVIRYVEGWCVLIPESWQEDEEFNFPGRFFGGPEIGEFWPGQPPYANIVIGFNGPAVDITLDQMVEGRMNANQHPDLVQWSDTVIGGFPSAILETQDGPFPERLAFILANGYIYTVLGQPFDDVAFPEAQPDLDMAWNRMINSIQFFEPYR
jgi:hypothetical protein